ncbi:restriction endonuclease [Paraliobacillus sp. X-1268]|uniref:5-methylcytosine restriction system specificity protein McrC n=1 Tax=Paraliobacillus sp. X-1268 TaxID=2213193 RepID=UPI000E3BE63D|nr:restriction endonuclease [Paraliobacillus sp. X-1268]
MKRISLVEYGTQKNVINDLSADLGVSHNKLIDIFDRTGEKVKDLLGFSKNPITISKDNSVRIVDFAGILRMGPSIEIEVAPKFLGLDSINRRWREDFFYLASLSKNGKLLNKDRLLASTGQRGDLHTLITRAFVEMYWDNQRKSLRTYRNNKFVDFSVDGDIDPESLMYPSPDGFAQTKLDFDKRNHYNGIIVSAAKQLVQNLNDPNLSIQLFRIIQDLSPQDTVAGNLMKRKLPNRLARWQELFNLSVDILKGFGLAYNTGNSIAPGYVLNTWRVWEDFLSLAINRGFGFENVKQQKQFSLGRRLRTDKASGYSNVRVKPDLVVSYSENLTVKEFIFDAKYKGQVEKGVNRISEQDVYESLAFANATNCNTILLAYPANPTVETVLGDAKVFEKIEIGRLNIIGIEVDSKGISSKEGIIHFSKNLSFNCLRIIREWT